VVNVTSNPPPVLSVKANLRPEAGGAAGLVVAFDPVRYTVRAVLDSADITAMRTGAIAAVAARWSRSGPQASEIGLQSRWYRQHRNPGAPDRPEPNETRGSPRSSKVNPGVHLVQHRAELHVNLSEAAF
jgi:hypothetical protein